MVLLRLLERALEVLAGVLLDRLTLAVLAPAQGVGVGQVGVRGEQVVVEIGDDLLAVLGGLLVAGVGVVGELFADLLEEPLDLAVALALGLRPDVVAAEAAEPEHQD